MNINNEIKAFHKKENRDRACKIIVDDKIYDILNGQNMNVLKELLVKHPFYEDNSLSI